MILQTEGKIKTENQSNLKPEYMLLYPQFETIKEQKELIPQKNINKNINEEDEEKYEINETFLEIVLKKPFSYGRNKIVNTLSKNIQSSALSKKLLKDYRSEKKINEANLCNLFSQSLNFSKLNANEILYRIGENDNRLFYILSGKIQVLKLKEIPFATMTNLDYLNYCKFLYKNNEIYILNEVINNNNIILPFMSEKDVLLVSKIYFMTELLEKLQKHMISKNMDLIKFLHLYDYSYNDFNIISSEINSIEQKKYKKMQGAEKEWEDYIIERCSPTESEYHFYEPFKKLLKSRQKKFINCYIYEIDSYLEAGNYFGDLSYDAHFIQNKFTIRAQEDSVLAWIKNNDYLNVIDPKRKIEALKIMSFLHNYFFFKEISNNSFEKNYYEYFSVHEFSRGAIIYESGDKPKQLMFLKEGKLSLEIKCNIIDLSFLIKDLFNALISNEIFNSLPNAKKKTLLTKETINILKKCAYNGQLKELIRKNPQLFNELQKTKVFHISEINGYDVIGIEEIFLNIPYIIKCTVNDKKVLCYGLPIKYISRVVKEGNELLYSFVQTAINKIISLIKRLDTLKNNSFNYEKMKFNYDLKMNEIKVNEIKTNNDSSVNNNLPLIKNNKNTLYDNYMNNQLVLKTDNSCNKSNYLNNFENSELRLNTNNSFYSTKSPVKKCMFTYNLKDVIASHKFLNKTSNFSKSNTKNISINERDSNINKQNIFRNNIAKNINSFPTKNADENKNENNTENNFFGNNSLLQKKKENILLLGKNKINIDNIKKNIDDFLSCDNSDKYVEIIQSNKFNNNNISNFYNHNIMKQNSYIEKTNLFRKRNFRLSLVPLNNLNIFTNNNLTLDENNDAKILYDPYKTNKQAITDFIGVNSINNYVPTFPNQNNNSKSVLPKKNIKLGLFKNRIHSQSKENNIYNNIIEDANIKNKIKKPVGKDIIKEYYNDIKMNGCLFFIRNKQSNSFYMKKFYKKIKSPSNK